MEGDFYDIDQGVRSGRLITDDGRLFGLVRSKLGSTTTLKLFVAIKLGLTAS